MFTFSVVFLIGDRFVNTW